VPRLAVYTTVYPAVETYLADWYASVRAQRDRDFRLWIALDGLDASTAARAMGGRVDAEWIPGHRDDTIGSIRQRALHALAGEHATVVLVDSDDVLHPTRVQTARAMLETCDVAGCALRLVDESGRSSGRIFGLPDGVEPAAVFPRANAFGLSNSAVRTALLQQCLPVPREAVLVDWFLWTRAWLLGARFAFGGRPEMDYRQYGANIARVLGPFTAAQVTEDTAGVLRHFSLVLASDLAGALPQRLQMLREAVAEVNVFSDRLLGSPAALERYVDGLNRLPGTMVWWQWVANPALRHLWATGQGER
jgi:hypothetical protein